MPAGSPAVRNVRSPSDRGAGEHVLNEIRAIECAGKSAFPACMCEAAMGRPLSDRSPLPPARTDNRPPATGTIAKPRLKNIVFLPWSILAIAVHKDWPTVALETFRMHRSRPLSCLAGERLLQK